MDWLLGENHLENPWIHQWHTGVYSHLAFCVFVSPICHTAKHLSMRLTNSKNVRFLAVGFGLWDLRNAYLTIKPFWSNHSKTMGLREDLGERPDSPAPTPCLERFLRRQLERTRTSSTLSNENGKWNSGIPERPRHFVPESQRCRTNLSKMWLVYEWSCQSWHPSGLFHHRWQPGHMEYMDTLESDIATLLGYTIQPPWGLQHQSRVSDSHFFRCLGNFWNSKQNGREISWVTAKNCPLSLEATTGKAEARQLEKAAGKMHPPPFAAKTVTRDCELRPLQRSLGDGELE